MKEYTLKIETDRGGCVSIAANTDNMKPIFVSINGIDTGKHYANIGNAARYLREIMDAYDANGIAYTVTRGTAASIPVYGCSEWNKQLFKYNYCGGAFPLYAMNGGKA